MSKYAAGQILSLIPSRKIFGLSSGSYTGGNAQKYRPCFVIDDKDGIITVIPLCGAVRNQDGSWGPRPDMKLAWWAPLHYMGTNINPPLGDFENRPWKALKVPYDSNVGMPQEHPQFKPSYIWCGDIGEVLDDKSLALARPLRQYIQLQEAQRKQLEEWWKTLQRLGMAPPP